MYRRFLILLTLIISLGCAGLSTVSTPTPLQTQKPFSQPTNTVPVSTKAPTLRDTDTPVPDDTDTPTATSTLVPTSTQAPPTPEPTETPIPPTSVPTFTDTPVPPPPTLTNAPPAANCDPSYPDICIPPPPPDLDCGDIPFRRFRVNPPDPHRFDGDHDGIGCESG
jgi:hypothetical protein